MLNELPDVRLSGENYNEIFHAYEMYNNLLTTSTHFYDEEVASKGRFMHDEITDGAFQHNAMPIGSFACVMQTLIHTINPPKLKKDSLPLDNDAERREILGVKTIRLHLGGWTPQEAAKFLQDNFPCARYVINIRSDVNAQVESMGVAFKKTNIDAEFRKQREKTLNDAYQFLYRLSNILGEDTARFIDMTEWTNDVSILNDLLKWLGFLDCAFNDIVHENHDGYGKDTTTQLNLGKNCRYPHD